MSVLVEGVAEINASILNACAADKVILFLAPRLMTGRDSLCSIGGSSPARLSQTVDLKDVTARFVGHDLMIEGYIR